MIITSIIPKYSIVHVYDHDICLSLSFNIYNLVSIPSDHEMCLSSPRSTCSHLGVQIEYDIQINEFQMSMPFYITLEGDCEESLPHVSNCSSHCHMSQTVQVIATCLKLNKLLLKCLAYKTP